MPESSNSSNRQTGMGAHTLAKHTQLSNFLSNQKMKDTVMSNFTPCVGCGAPLHVSATICPKCGEQQPPTHNNSASRPQIAARPNATPPTASAVPNQSYSDIPFYRRRWFLLLTVLFFVPLAGLIAATGPLYYLKKQVVHKFPNSARVFWVILSIVAILLVGIRAASMFGGGGGIIANSTGCGSKETVDVLKAIFVKSVKEEFAKTGLMDSGGTSPVGVAISGALAQMQINVTGVRTNGTEVRGKRLSCVAMLEVTVPAATAAAISSPLMQATFAADQSIKSVQFEGNVVRDQVTYTRQVTDKGDEFYVEAHGTEGLVQVIGSALTLALVDAPATASATPAATQTAAASPAAVQPPIVPVPSNQKEYVAAQAAPRRAVSQVTLQEFVCGDYCHLKFVDAGGNTQSAICSDTNSCQSWAESPKGFTRFIGAKADLVLGKKFIPEGNTTMDNIVEMKLADVSPQPERTPIPTTATNVKAANKFCGATETTVFACSTGKKTITVCASRDLSSNAGQLTYRLTPIDGSVEMTYPNPPQHPNVAFKVGLLRFTGDKTLSFLSFDKGSYRYVIYAADGKAFYDKGVAVEQGGKKVASLKCQGDAEVNWDAIENARIANDTRGFAVP